MEFPPERAYDGYPQIDNGVGLVRDFLSEFARERRRLPRALREPRSVLLVTGVSFAPILREAASRLAGIRDLSLRVLPVRNRLFGDSVTVAGLLPGLDIVQALKGKEADAAVVPSVAVREGEGVFLDDMDITDVERMAGMRVHLAEPNARGLVEAIRNIV
jgi:NifB/MoaA-like Fe-S oxidoreductase